jgi:hypothetical protein
MAPGQLPGRAHTCTLQCCRVLWLALAFGGAFAELAAAITHDSASASPTTHPRPACRAICPEEASVSVSFSIVAAPVHISLCVPALTCVALICPHPSSGAVVRPLCYALCYRQLVAAATRPVYFLEPQYILYYTYPYAHSVNYCPHVMRLAALHRTAITMAR